MAGKLQAFLEKVGSFNGWQRIWFFLSLLLLLCFGFFYIQIIEDPFLGFELLEEARKEVKRKEIAVKNKNNWCESARQDYSNFSSKQGELEKEIMEKELIISNLNKTINDTIKEIKQVKNNINKQQYKVIKKWDEEIKYLSFDIKHEAIREFAKEIQKETDNLMNREKILTNKMNGYKAKITELNNTIKNIKYDIRAVKIGEEIKNNQLLSKIDLCVETENELYRAKNYFKIEEERKLIPMWEFLGKTFKFLLSYLASISFLYAFGYGLGWIYQGFKKN